MPATQAKPKFPSFTAKVKESIKADPRYKNLLSCINRTWQCIGPDSEAACAEMGEKPMKKSERLETVLDANYMSTNCGKDGKEAEAYVEELDKTYGYKAVAKFLTAEAYI
jgi:hypothetical protein